MIRRNIHRKHIDGKVLNVRFVFVLSLRVSLLLLKNRVSIVNEAYLSSPLVTKNCFHFNVLHFEKKILKI